MAKLSASAGPRGQVHGPAREVSLIAMVCAGYEKTIAKDSWRSPGSGHLDYLTRLVGWGYMASPVEQIILDSAAPA
jgi:ParB family transcriptional regulator, chromosome partitioning protein